MRFSNIRPALAALPLVTAMALAGCSEPAETAYETDVVDESGGELIVSEVDPDAVPVEVPETAMVPVQSDSDGDDGEGDTATE